MKWEFLNTKSNTGKYNMDFDMNLAETTEPGMALLRFYQWKPYCISLGANQGLSTINIKKAYDTNIDLVKRPTGGRAILHSEELTYSVVYPLTNGFSSKDLYREINLALKKGMIFFDSELEKIELEEEQPHFPSFYKNNKSNLCFAVSAKNELKFEGKKLVGSAQRKMNNSVLQHGSILCGDFHKNIVDFLFLNDDETLQMRKEIKNTTTDLRSILNYEINYDLLGEAIKTGFEEHFKIKFEHSFAQVKI
jgi:lipoate-protein ligase A